MWCCSSSNKNRAPAKQKNKKLRVNTPRVVQTEPAGGFFLTAAGQCGLCFTQEFLLQNAAACPGPPQPPLFSFDADSQSFRRSTTRGRRFCTNGNFSDPLKQKAVLLKRPFLSRGGPKPTPLTHPTQSHCVRLSGSPGWGFPLRSTNSITGAPGGLTGCPAKSLYGTFALCGTAQSCKSSRRAPS